MSRFFADRVVELCGIVSSVLTVALVLLIEKWLDFSIFTLSLWVIVPVGAFLTGFAAASGYYFGALLVHHKPSRILLMNMVLIAASTFFLIYYIQYRTLTIEGKNVADYIPFTTFLQVVLTKAEYGLARVQNASFEVGAFGYVIAGLQLLGFMIGGFATYAALAAKPFCENCRKYLKKLVEFRRSFDDGKAFEPFAQRIYSLSPPSAEYLHILREPHEVNSVKQGSVAIGFGLFGCPNCESEVVVESPQVYKGDNWSDLSDYERRFKIPIGTSIRADFNTAKTGKAPIARQVSNAAAGSAG